MDAALHPWAHGLGAHDPQGEWRGEFVSAWGERYAVFLSMKHEIQHNADAEPVDLEISTVVCPGAAESGGRGRVSWTGSTVTLGLSAAFGTHGTPNPVACSWQGDKLACEVDFSRHYNEAIEKVAKKAGIVHQWKPSALLLSRGSRAEFDASCVTPRQSP